MKSMFVLLVICGLSSSATADDIKALQATWETGFFRAPTNATLDRRRCSGEMVATDACYTKIDTSRKHPVVIFATDCTGFYGTSPGISKHTITVSPNSSARPNWRSNCAVDAEIADEDGFLGLPFVEDRNAMELRFAEVRYAYGELIKLPWVDKDRIYLAGFSEGGAVAALYTGDPLAGRIILGWTCASRTSWFEGIKGRRVPILAIVGSDDRYNQTPDRNGRECGEHFKGRPDSRSLVLKGIGHELDQQPATIEAVRRFIEEVVYAVR